MGISIDGKPSTHDEFRNMPGAFAAAIKGIHACIVKGLNRDQVCCRYNRRFAGDTDIVEKENMPRFVSSPSICGPGSEMADMDTSLKKPGKSWIS